MVHFLLVVAASVLENVDLLLILLVVLSGVVKGNLGLFDMDLKVLGLTTGMSVLFFPLVALVLGVFVIFEAVFVLLLPVAALLMFCNHHRRVIR